MHGLVKLFFAELCLSIQEYHVHVKNTVRPTVIVNGCGSAHGNLDALHTVLRAQCHNGASYCLDFTCAQYGWQDYISPWETFAQLRVRTASFSEPFGTAHARLRKDAHVPGPAQAPTSFFFETADRLAWIVKEWFVQRRLTVGSLLVSPEEEFRAARSYLLEHVYWQFGKAMDKMALEKQYHLALRDQAVFIQRKTVEKQRKSENFFCKDWL
ncbi:MAG: hypothetical protein M1821_001084 [Bathelium mastoideum]|nr:MAG: hypothetical protein M1821_001084 [Bathelium mastoideum]